MPHEKLKLARKRNKSISGDLKQYFLILLLRKLCVINLKSTFFRNGNSRQVNVSEYKILSEVKIEHILSINNYLLYPTYL